MLNCLLLYFGKYMLQVCTWWQLSIYDIYSYTSSDKFKLLNCPLNSGYITDKLIPVEIRIVVTCHRLTQCMPAWMLMLVQTFKMQYTSLVFTHQVLQNDIWLERLFVKAYFLIMKNCSISTVNRFICSINYCYLSKIGIKWRKLKL